MFSNISPYLCTNMHEFDDERAHLKEITFPKIKTYYEKLGINFDPIQIEWNETDDIAKSGSLLRLLLHSIVKSSPFFICLLGKRYGTYLERNEFKKGSSHQIHSNEINDVGSSMWIEKNLQIASHTGYDYIVNSQTFNNSFTELQINTAINDENNYSFLRFYYRQIEFLDEKFSELSLEVRKKAIDEYEAENDYCDYRMKDLKMKIAKKGLIVKYYKSLKELDELIFNDYVEIIHALINSNLIDVEKSRFELKLENYVLNKLHNYMITDSIRELFKSLDKFIKRKHSHNVHFKLDSSSIYSLSDNYMDNFSRSDINNYNECSDDELMQQSNDEHLQILKLRHINLSRSVNSIMGRNSNLNDNQRSINKNIFLITGARGKGKSSFMALVYQQLYLFKSLIFSDSPLLSESSTEKINNLSSARAIKSAQLEPFYLFYFLKPGDHFITVLIDIILKMRLKYLNKDCRYSISNELFDEKSIIEQFHACVCLGPVVILIDGLSELDSSHTIKLYNWLPPKQDFCKFVFSLNKSSEYYVDLVNTRSCLIYEIKVFLNDLDYKNIFAKLLSVNKNSTNSNEIIDRNALSKNVLYGKFLTFFDELKSSSHYSNPLFIQIIAQEFFSYDKDIYKNSAFTINSTTNSNKSLEQVLNVKSENNSNQSDYDLNEFHFSNDISKSILLNTTTANNDNNTSTNGSVNIISSYIEEVSTLSGIMEKIIKRYIKKNNWSLDNTLPLSFENSGWVGDALCLIALSVHGIDKESIMRILDLKGYVEDLKVNDVNWRLFRMQFGEFILEGHNGKLTFCHIHFKEAVQTLLMDGFSVLIDFNKPEPSGPSCKKNISIKQKEIHSFIIIDILENQLNKSDFDFFTQLNKKKRLNINRKLSENYIEILHELIVHLYMIYDLVNLCKLITSFKVIQIFYDNRMSHLNEWYDFCNYLKLTINFETLRPILLSSFTIGIPQYVIEQHDDVIYFRNLKNQKNIEKSIFVNNINQNKNNDENKKLRFSKSELAQINQQSENIRFFKSPLKSSKALTKSFNSHSNHSMYSILSDNRNNFDMTEYYEPLIDILIDLNGMNDFSKSKYSDTYNMLLINRAIVMVDLMKNLDDKYFLEKYAYLLCLNVNNIVVQNYPLNDTEKLKYATLLQILANLSNQMCLFDHSLRYLIKSIEILEDLYSNFSSNDLNPKYKTKLQLYNIGYRLSHLYSNMALMLFKMNELDNIDLLLTKAREYYRKNLSSDGSEKLDIQSSINSLMKFDTESFTELLNRKQNLHDFMNINLTNKEDDKDDGGIYEAKYFYYLVSSLFEVQKLNFKKANNLFQSAVNISIKCYGQNHVNTSKIYHYYGCFFSLKDMAFYNPQKAELYLRKALYIREKSKIENPIENIENSKYNVPTFNPSQFDSISKISHFSSNDENSFQNLLIEDSFLNNKELVELKSNPVSEKLILNDEKNTIAEILYDLGCLLATYESNISKKEAIDFLRRSLDIKVLIFGEKYWDCQVIKNRLNELVVESTQLNMNINKINLVLSNRENTRSLTNYSSIYRNLVSSNINMNNTSSFYQSTSSKKIAESSPQKSLELLKKQMKLDTKNSLLDKWLEKNSIIEKIPSKQLIDKTINSNRANSKNENQSSLAGDNKVSYGQEKSSYLDNEFIKSTIYIDQNTNMKSQPDLQKQTQAILEQNETSTKLNILLAKHYPRPKTQHQKENINEDQKLMKNLKLQRSKSYFSNFKIKSSTDCHKRACDCPTALSIDIHNSRIGVHGPNSNLKNLLNVNVIEKNKSEIKNKITKHIYYKSAWYDLPNGTSKKRFKTFIKLKPNV